MYAGPPKFAQELFFWSYHLRVRSSNYRKYLVVEEHWYVQLYSSDIVSNKEEEEKLMNCVNHPNSEQQGGAVDKATWQGSYFIHSYFGLSFVCPQLVLTHSSDLPPLVYD